jgi:hypothetical protein
MRSIGLTVALGGVTRASKLLVAKGFGAGSDFKRGTYFSLRYCAIHYVPGVLVSFSSPVMSGFWCRLCVFLFYEVKSQVDNFHQTSYGCDAAGGRVGAYKRAV